MAGTSTADNVARTAPTIAAHTAVKPIQRNTPPPRLEIHPLIGDRATSQGLEEIPDPEVDEIVPRGEHHQRQPQGQANSKSIFLCPLPQRFSAQCLRRIKQQMPPVKNR